MKNATKTRAKRNIVKIDESKCNGCGLCVIKCAEGALKIIDGKARIISENYCDGLGACLGECPQDAIIIEERVADPFDEEAVEEHLSRKDKECQATVCGCASATPTLLKPGTASKTESTAPLESRLGHWPVQLTLVPPTAPFLRNADILLTADCVPFAYPAIHRDFLADHALLVACPKLDDFDAHLEKLTEIIAKAGPKSLTVLHMEVPCCSGLTFMARQAIKASGREVPLKEVTIGVDGVIK